MPVAKRFNQLQGIAPQSVHEVSTTVSTRVSTRSRSPRLTDSQIGAAKANGKQQDFTDPACRGLVLRISPTGSKSWLFRYKWNRTAVRIGLGQYPSLSLADARTQALEYSKLIKSGIDPRLSNRDRLQQGRLPPRKPTNSDVPRPKVEASASNPVIETLESEARTKSPGKIEPPTNDDQFSVQRLAHEFVHHFILPRRERPEEVIRILNKDVLPYWGHRDARTISQREVVTRLDQIVSRGACVMANRTANILSSMFKFGIHRALVKQSPVNLLFRPGGDEPPRTRALNEIELTAFVRHLQSICIGTNRAPVHMILLLTLQRRSSLALAEWSEIDLEEGLWNIPAEHDKMRRAHQLPLTPWAKQEFLALKSLAGNSRFVLPNRSGESPADPQLISRSTERLQSRFSEHGIAKFTTHDIRRTGRTFLAKIGVSAEVAERILNHQKDAIEFTYNRYDYIDEKRIALLKWEKFLAQLRGN